MNSRERIYIDRLKVWEGQEISTESIQYLDKINDSGINYHKIKFEGKNYWVIRQKFCDRRVIISRELEVYLGIPTLEYLICGRFILIKSYNPTKTPELTLTQYVKQNKDKIPLYLHRQIQNLLSFRYLIGASQNTNSSICIRREGRRLVAYNFKLTFKEERVKFSQGMIATWFIGISKQSSSKRQRTIEECIYNIIIGPDYEFGNRRKLGRKIDKLDDFLTEIIPQIDQDLVWFQSDIINILIEI